MTLADLDKAIQTVRGRMTREQATKSTIAAGYVAGEPLTGLTTDQSILAVLTVVRALEEERLERAVR